jgi:hypothetical protein
VLHISAYSCICYLLPWRNFFVLRAAAEAGDGVGNEDEGVDSDGEDSEQARASSLSVRHP